MSNQDILYGLYIEKGLPTKVVSLMDIEIFVINEKSNLKSKSNNISISGLNYAVLKFILEYCVPLEWPYNLWGDFKNSTNPNNGNYSIWKKYPNLKVKISHNHSSEYSSNCDDKIKSEIYPEQNINIISTSISEFIDEDMKKFVEFIINKIENESILGKKGWHEHLESYQWPPKKGNLKDGINIRRHFYSIVNLSSNSIGRSSEIFRYGVCNAIAGWGGLPHVSIEDCFHIFNSIDFINNHLDKNAIDYGKIFGERIALSSKLYYFSNPSNWTIYDSRVAFTLSQMTYIFKNENPNIFAKLKDKIAFPIPPTQAQRFHPFEVKWKGSEASLWFIRASLLLKAIAEYLNKMSIQPPFETISSSDKWELYHVEMVFFQLGGEKWYI